MKLKQLYKTRVLEFYPPAAIASCLEIPFFESGVKAGFPSPAEDFSELSIDLNAELLKNPSATFFSRVNGDSMKDIGIGDGDLLVIDKSLKPENGKIAVCFIDGEFTLKSIRIEKDCCWLIPANKEYKSIKVDIENDFAIWGIVTHVIKSF
ncbi:MAG: translesion error-prone DNA polymerase V autoproteolytic subunit [Chitinophagales bacterium]